MKTSKWFIVAIIVALASGSLAATAAAAQPTIGMFGKPLLQVDVLAGSGEYGEANGAASGASFRSPQGLAVLPDGSVIVADTKSQLLRKVSAGQVSTYAGVTFDADALGQPLGGLIDGTALNSLFQTPAAIGADAAGNVYVADANNHAIRKISPAGRVTTVAGDAEGVLGYADGAGTEARFYYPADIAVAADGTVYVADTLNHAIRKITPNGAVTTLNAISSRVAQVFSGVAESAGDFRDGKLSEALFNEPAGIALDAAGNLYVSDTGNQLIRYIDLQAGTVKTVAGGGVQYAEDALYAAGDYADGPADEARFDFPKGLAVTSEGGVIIADSLNHAIRYLHDGKVTTWIGNASAAHGAALGTELAAQLHNPVDVALDRDGNVLIADSYNNRIVRASFYSLPDGVGVSGEIGVAYGQRAVAFDDAKPRNVDGRVMVPVRTVTETLGYVVYTADNEHITLRRGSTEISLTVGGVQAEKQVDGERQTYTLDVATFVSDGRTYVPVRFLSEQLGLQVDWIPAQQTVVIRD